MHKKAHDAKCRHRQFHEGDRVLVKNHGAGPQWLPGTIVKCSGPVSFHVQLEDGRRRRCHQDQLLSRAAEEAESEVEPVPAVSSSLGSLILPGPVTGVCSDHGDQETDRNCESEVNVHDRSSDTSTDQPTETSTELPDSNVRSSNERRYPLRTRIPREHFELMIFCVCMYIDVYACILGVCIILCMMYVYTLVHVCIMYVFLLCMFYFLLFLYVPSYGGRNVIILYDWSVM